EVTWSTPPPPYSRGIAYEVSPACAAFSSSSAGNFSRGAIGRSSRWANSRASAWSARCSGVGVNETPPVTASRPCSDGDRLGCVRARHGQQHCVARVLDLRLEAAGDRVVLGTRVLAL